MGVLTLTGIKAVQFEVDTTLQINGTGLTFGWPANTPVSFGDAASVTITQANVKVALMKNMAAISGEPIQVFRIDLITSVA